jgi:glycosyltransferase involved in cell wall biosynthesis
MHIIGSRQLGGAEHFYMRFVHALGQRGLSVLAVNRPHCPVNTLMNGTVAQQTVPMRNGWDLLSVYKIRRLIRSKAPLIVQTYMGRATRLTRLPHDTTAVHVARLGGYYNVRGYYQHADAWVANTRGLCDYLVHEGLDANRVYHIGNFVKIPPEPIASAVLASRRALRIPSNAVVFFSLGRFYEMKGFDDLLAAFAQLPREIHARQPVLIVAGDGPLKIRLHNLSRQLELTDRVRWVGWQTDPDPYFDLADAFVCPSRRETLGNVILEAWAHRLPVIATRTPGALELIAEEQNGLMVEIQNPTELADRMTALMKAGPSSWQNLGENGLMTVRQNHTEEAVLEAYLDLYARLQPGHAAATRR